MVIHGKTGLLVPPNDVEELIRAIKAMTSDELMRSGWEIMLLSLLIMNGTGWRLPENI